MVKIKIPLKTFPMKVEEVRKFQYEGVEGDQALVRYLVNKEAFRPVKLSTKLADYAGKLEFGMHPDEEPLSYDDQMALSKWVTDKMGIFGDESRRDVMSALINKYRYYGMIPRPWFRPAIHSAFDEIESLFDNGRHSFYDIAVEMRDRAYDNLEKLGINYSGALHNSLQVEWLNEDEYRRVMGNNIDQKVIDEYWKRYRLQTEVIPNDDDKTRDKREAEWPLEH